MTCQENVRIGAITKIGNCIEAAFLAQFLNIYELNQIFHSQLYVVNKTTILLPTNITLLGPYIP